MIKILILTMTLACVACAETPEESTSASEISNDTAMAMSVLSTIAATPGALPGDNFAEMWPECIHAGSAVQCCMMEGDGDGGAYNVMCVTVRGGNCTVAIPGEGVFSC